MKVTTDGKVIYRTGKSKGLRFPVPCDERLKPGASRNFQVFEPLEFLAEVTQHIPDKGQHQVHYFGYYSNKSRGLRQRSGQVDMQPSAWHADTREREQDTEFCRKRRKTWAALIQCVYEVDPLKCTKCVGTMKIISFIEKCQTGLAEKILRHCGLWIDAPQRPPPVDYADFEESSTVEGGLLQEPLAMYDEVRQEEPPVVFDVPPSDDGFF